MASPVVSPLAAIAVDCTGHRSCAAKHLAIDRLAAGPDVVRRSNQKHASFFRVARYGSVTGVPIKSRLASSTPQLRKIS
jgi:hypothetical protein